ncbi:hypothetical protein OKW37_000314 [Paraburkholderia sp. MM5482-R2]
MLRWLRTLIPAIALVWMPCGIHAADDFAPRRAKMINDIADLTAETFSATGRPAIDPRVLDAMDQVPRHQFVRPGEERDAYENRPLPIGYGQTISQPYIVALMTDLMMIKPTDVVLEVGTGSGTRRRSSRHSRERYIRSKSSSLWGRGHRSACSGSRTSG